MFWGGNELGEPGIGGLPGAPAAGAPSFQGLPGIAVETYLCD